MIDPRRALALVATLLLALGVAACGGDDEESSGSGETQEQASDVKGNITVAGVWSGPEQQAFQKVLDGFTEQNPGVKVKYNSAGDQLPTVLSTAVEGGNPPDIAFVAQPGLAQDFAKRGELKEIEFARSDIEEGFSEDWVKLGTFEDKLYGLPFKGANKSTIWFNTQVIEDAGVEPPTTYDELIESAKTINASGVPAYSIAGADGWTLTDLFENLYLRIAGPEKYDQLSTHEIPWTDQSVKDTLKEMARIYSDKKNIAGGTNGALETEFPKSVSQVFASEPKAAAVIEGDFVGGVITAETKAKPGDDFDVMPFPAVGDSGENVVMGGGDMMVMFKDSPAAQAFVKYLATPEAAEAWAKEGGFSSPNKNVDPNVYPDEITKTTATALAEAETFRFDMSDLAPASFGGTPGAGEWKILQDFLANPEDIDGTASALEKAAKKAFK